MQKVLDELRTIKIEIEFIKEHMVDADTVLTSEERVLVDESFENEKNNELVPSDELRRELKIWILRLIMISSQKNFLKNRINKLWGG